MSKSARGLDPKAYRTIGTTYDGVSILKPKTKPTHFTTREIRTTIRALRQVQGTAKVPETATPDR